MTVPEVSTAPETEWPFSDPKPFLWFGLAAVVAAWLVSWLPAYHGVTTFRALLIVLGVIAAGAGVALRPGWILGLFGAALTALVAAAALDRDWDSARLLLFVAAGLAVLVGSLLGLPELLALAYQHWQRPAEQGRAVGRIASRTAVSLLVLGHFFAILSTVMAVPPGQGRPQPWLAAQSLATVEPYLQFVYLRNAYHFYAPEPGPAALAWFRVEYEDGSALLIYLPERKNPHHAPDPLTQEYTRRLSIANAITDSEAMPLLDPGVRQVRLAAGMLQRNKTIHLRELRGPDGELLGERVLSELAYREDKMVDRTDVLELTLPDGIEFHPEIPIDGQYSVANRPARENISDFARHVARSYPSLVEPKLKVTGVKVYKVVHNMLDPAAMAHLDEDGAPDAHPTDRPTYRPYYMGDYTPDGELKNLNDPFLFWLIPIYMKPVGPATTPVEPRSDVLAGRSGPRAVLRDCLRYHGALPTRVQGGDK